MKKNIAWVLVLLGLISSQSIAGTNKEAQKNKSKNKHEIAVFGAGCFWCVEAIFQTLEGVIKVEPGYSGGTVKNPSSREVSTGNTGHAEVAHIVFDPDIISFEFLLSVFFQTHDPTTLNYQGADRGTEYRSAIFYTTEEQKKISERQNSDMRILL